MPLTWLFNGGDDRTRTDNPLLAKQVRYQLRHVPGSRRTSLARSAPSTGGRQTLSVAVAQGCVPVLALVLLASTLRHTAKPAAETMIVSNSFFIRALPEYQGDDGAARSAESRVSPPL